MRGKPHSFARIALALALEIRAHTALRCSILEAFGAVNKAFVLSAADPFFPFTAAHSSAEKLKSSGEGFRTRCLDTLPPFKLSRRSLRLLGSHNAVVHRRASFGAGQGGQREKQKLENPANLPHETANALVHLLKAPRTHSSSVKKQKERGQKTRRVSARMLASITTHPFFRRCLPVIYLSFHLSEEEQKYARCRV